MNESEGYWLQCLQLMNLLRKVNLVAKFQTLHISKEIQMYEQYQDDWKIYSNMLWLGFCTSLNRNVEWDCIFVIYYKVIIQVKFNRINRFLIGHSATSCSSPYTVLAACLNIKLTRSRIGNDFKSCFLPSEF